nr:unnamed protein product [Callosobruchus analis]
MLTHAEDYGKDPKIKCELCGKRFSRMKYLKGHIIRVHQDGGQRFVCDLCGKEVRSKTSLRDHMLIHQGVKPIQCPQCDKCFTIRNTLKSHMRTHTGVRPYRCEECDPRGKGNEEIVMIGEL